MNKENNLVKLLGEPITLDQLGEFVLTAVNHKIQKSNKVIHLSWEVKYYDKVSCSHNSPIGKRTNFMGDPEFPRHFPGWMGRIWIVYNKRPLQHSQDYNSLEYLHIYTGSGGYGNYKNPYFTAIHPNKQFPCSWDVKIFEDDWPAIKVNHKLISNKEFKEHIFNYTLDIKDEEN